MERLLDTLRTLIAFDTRNPGGDEQALARHLELALARFTPDYLERVEHTPPGEPPWTYVYASWGEPRVLLNAHIDTVPANRGWTRDPLEAWVDGDRLVGLGASDIKGAVAALLDALEDARPRDCAVLFSGDEERANRAMLAFADSALARRSQRAVVCEPTGCRAGVRHRGMLHMSADIVREGGHSSRADHLPAPLVELAAVALDLHAWARERRPLGPAGFEGTCLNVAALDGGIAFNVVPEAARLTFSVRPAPGSAVETYARELGALVHARVPDARLESHLAQPPFATRDVSGMLELLGSTAGATVDLPFWTEAAILAERGYDAVVFGPGHVEQAHGADEWVSLAELRQARDVFRRIFDGRG
jgi:acetylornithine deacetylase